MAERTLLQRVATGDAEAVRLCIEAFGPLVQLLCRRLLADKREVEDASQEIFLEIWRLSSKYDPAIASERAFVAMIARRRLIDKLRARKVSVRAGADDGMAAMAASSEATAGERLARAEGADLDAARAAEAMALLRPEQQQMLRMSIGLGWSHQRIADHLNAPLGTVKTTLRRGLLRLREALSGKPLSDMDAEGEGDSASTVMSARERGLAP
ncbi:MAG: sigma-70 family RNA polymerase sigma factor [Planctomycetaceae bacterium]|jgi:RNA polymerase sigma-70 factor (ECF subfamily)|nr:sigma-70 family RNA polymerase sigma factor [Planctomycetaceae bacterium]